MAMVVKNNLSAVRTLNVLNSNSAALQKGMARVSSGMKITGAQDDAAGYAISERMRVRIRALDQANQNSQNDSALMKTAEGAVGNTIDILKALKEKCINAANDSNTDEDRQTIQKEIDQYIDQIDDNALVTFNGKYLIDGSKNNAAIDTKTVLLNQSLSTDTKSSTALTDLASRTNESLGIQDTDYYQVSWVENGKIHSTSGQVGDATLKDIIDGVGVNGSVVETTDEGLIQAVAPEPEAEPDPLEGFTSLKDPLDATVEVDISDAIGEGIVATDLAELQSIFVGDTTVNDATLNDGDGIADITDYYMVTEEGKAPEQVTISFTYHADIAGAGAAGTPTDEGYEVTIKNAAGEEVTPVDGKLYTKDAPTPPATYGTTEGTLAEPKLTTYDDDDDPDTPEVALQIPSSDPTATNAASLTEAKKWANLLGTDADTLDGMTSGQSVSKVIYGVYSLGAKDDNGNDTYELVEGGLKITYDCTTIGKGTLTFTQADGTTALDSTTRGADLYILDMDDPQNIKTLADTGLDNMPATITKAEEATESEDGGKLGAVQNKYKRDLYTPDNTQGVAVIANEAGVNKQISGLTINILDRDHNVKKAANACLDQFKQYQRAENVTGDKSLNFQLGSEANQAIKVGLTDMRAQALGLKGSNGDRIDVFTKEHANAAINVIENALTKALDQQTTIGAIESRLEYTSTNLTTASENVQASESTIRDADMAKEMTNYTKANVLLQAAQAMLAQANQSSSSVLSLLQ